MMTFNNYQIQAAKFAEYENQLYPFLGLAEESGEFCGKIAKHLRGDGPIDSDAALKEAGDVLWQLTMCLSELGLSLRDAAEHNIVKLRARQEQGNIKGEGDDRELPEASGNESSEGDA